MTVTKDLSLPFLNYSKHFRIIAMEFLLQYFWLSHMFQKTYLAVVVGVKLVRVDVALPNSTSRSVHLLSGVRGHRGSTLSIVLRKTDLD